MKTAQTWVAKIYVGMRVGYTDEIIPYLTIEKFLQEFCDNRGFCVTIDPTTFIYTKGQEPGIVVGIIQYPKYWLPLVELRMRTLEIAKGLMDVMKQTGVSVVFPEDTIWLAREDL